MEIEQELAAITPKGKTLLTLGVFDGVHAGHRYLLERLKQQAAHSRLLSGVITFNPHPQSVLHPHDQLPSLSDLDDRIKALQQLGIDIVAVLSFTPQVARLAARDFMQLLKKHLDMQGIVVGPDFVLGRGGEGSINLLRTLGREMNFSVDVVVPYTIDGEVVSSTLIRKALAQGDMGKVQKLMGRHFYVRGKVITSDKRGRDLGFPTANLDIKLHQALPDSGVYATITQVDGAKFLSATNIGVRPTFGDGQRIMETHLLDYEGDLYGKEIQVQFVQRLRGEKRFASPQALKMQIKKDIKQVEALLAGDSK